MKMLETVEKILDKYDLTVDVPKGCSNVYACTEKQREELKLYPKKNDSYFVKKYKDYIPPGWYGFAIGSPTPEAWVEAIDEVLELLIKEDENLQIQQIKMKFGGIRFYVESEKVEDIHEIGLVIEDQMYSRKLAY